MILKKLGMLFIIVGIGLLVFVVFATGKTYFEQKKLQEEYVTLNQAGTKDQQKQSKAKDGEAIGILQIPKINLKVVIVEGDTQDDIRYAVGHLPASSSFSGLGRNNQNIALAGHRSYTYGKFFNRLNELQKNDVIIIEVQKQRFTYHVMKKRIIDPSNVGVINPVKDQSLVTLITCHPAYSDKYRLIVTAKFVSKKAINAN